jgi:putative glutamine amidotransferase
VDGVLEAVELVEDRQFLLGIQWHPERSYATSTLSRRIFQAFVTAASGWAPEPPTEES